MRNKNKQPIIFLLLIATLATVGMFVFYAQDKSNIVFADTATDTEETQEKIEELEKKAEVYRKIIEVKQKQGSMLNGQIEQMNSDIAESEKNIAQNQRKIEDLNIRIAKLEEGIREKERVVESQQQLLAKLIESYYESNRENVVTAYLADNSMTSFLVKKDRLVQTGDKIKEMLDSVKSLKQKLESDRSSLVNDKKEIVGLHIDLQEKNAELENTKSQKQGLLVQTRGEEARYKQLLARVEAQKLELLDLDQLFGSGGYSIDDFPKPPKSAQASLDWYYSQRDPSWANVNIGNSKSSMKSWGCAVTSVAMVFKNHGASITPKTLAKQPIFSWDLIQWPKSWSAADVSLNSSTSHGNISWSRIDSEIKKGNPVIVYIKKSKGGGHYVVVHHKDGSKYVVHDPYFGANLYLDTSRALVGGGGVTSVDQMIIYN